MTAKTTCILALCLVQAAAHITMTPNHGAQSGNYFKMYMKVPHGTHGKETTKLVMKVPNGILAVKVRRLHRPDTHACAVACLSLCQY